MSTDYVNKVTAKLKLARPETLDEAIAERDIWAAITVATQEKLQAQQNRDSDLAAKIGLPDPITLEQAIAERNGWLTAAAHAHDGMAYYRGIVDEIGAAIGPEAYTDDVGKLHDSVLRAKVAELVIPRLKAFDACTRCNPPVKLLAIENEAFEAAWNKAAKGSFSVLPGSVLGQATQAPAVLPENETDKFERNMLVELKALGANKSKRAPIVPSAAQLEAEASDEIGFGELDQPVKDA